MSYRGDKFPKHTEKAVLEWIGRKSRGSIGRVFLLSAISMAVAGSMILLALVSSRLIDVITGNQKGSLGRYLGILTLIIILQGGSNILYSNVKVRVQSALEMGIQREIFAGLLNKRYQAIKKIHSGEILNGMTSDIGIVVGGIVTLVPQALSMGLKLTAGLLVLFRIDWTFTCVVLAAGCVVAGAGRVFSHRFRFLHKEVQQSDGRVRSFVQECVENVMVIKSFSDEEFFRNKLEQYHKKSYQMRIHKNAVTNLANTAVYMAFTGGYYGAMAWGAIGIARGSFTFGTLTAFLQIIEQIRAPFRNISGLIPQYYSMIASAERLMELEQLEEEAAKDEEQEDTGDLYEQMEGIQAEGLWFRYEERQEYILKDCSFFLPKGKLTVLLGDSGIGKSSLMKLMLYLETPCGGTLRFKGENLDKQLSAGTREMFAYVPQGNMILSGSVRENLLLGQREVSQEEIRQAVRMACIEKEIDQLPQGFDTVLSERGGGLSEGQIQRLAIARALLTKAPVLLLDECTSSLDEKTEKEILKNLSSMKTRTVFCISHRKSILDYCDRIFWLRDGKVWMEKGENCDKQKGSH